MATETALGGIGGFQSSDTSNSLTWADQNATYDLYIHSVVAGIVTINGSKDPMILLARDATDDNFWKITVPRLSTLTTNSAAGAVTINWVKR